METTTASNPKDKSQEKPIDGELDSDISIVNAALDGLAHAIKNATTSMTSIPRPIKFLKEHYGHLCELYESKISCSSAVQESSAITTPPKSKLADILSVLSMAYGEEDKRRTLFYRLDGQSVGPAHAWGHEYASHLAMEIMHDYVSSTGLFPKQRLQSLAGELISFFLSNNAEADACDLAVEVEILPQLESLVDKRNYERITLYLSSYYLVLLMFSCVHYEAPPDDEKILRLIHTIYRKVNDIPKAILVALRLGDLETVQQDFASANKKLKRQLSFMLARERIIPDKRESDNDTEDRELVQILTNSKLSHFFHILASEFKVIEPKSPEEIYKRHLENPSRYSSLMVPTDHTKEDLASIFVNGLLNAGFGSDKLILGTDGETRLLQSKNNALLCNVASIGLMHLWNVEVALSHLDKFLESTDSHVKAGALLAVGIVSCNVENEAEPAMALLSESLFESPDNTIRACATLGLGIAYIGTRKEFLLPVLLPLLDISEDAPPNMELIGLASLSLGLIFGGSCHSEIASSIIQTLMSLEGRQLDDPFAQLIVLGLSFLFIGRSSEYNFDEKNEGEDMIAVVLESIQVLPNLSLVKGAESLIQMMSYAGSGNVLKIQEIAAATCQPQHTEPINDTVATTEAAEPTEETMRPANSSQSELNSSQSDEKHHELFKPYSVVALAAIALGEEIGTEMSFRLLGHLMHYGDASIRRAVPLAMALLSISAPKTIILESLSKYSHDHDAGVAMSAILALGLIGAGTNNSRLAIILRSLASYYSRDGQLLFVVRFAQGLLHAGKGILNLSPLHAHKSLLCKPSLMALLSICSIFLSLGPELLVCKFPYLLFLVVPALYPRFLMTVDANTLEPLNVSVRVGQAVDVVGQAGRPKTITGFQTHATPVILSYSERAELATEAYTALSPILEGVVLLESVPQ